MKISYEMHTALQYRCRNAEARVKEFENGDAYRKMAAGKAAMRRYYEHKIRKLEKEIDRLERQTVTNREKWFEVFQDVQDECAKRVAVVLKEMEKLQQGLCCERQKSEELKKKLKEKTREVVEERAKTNEEKEKIQNLTAQMNQNSGNSSIPSSQDRFRDKVPNNREPSGRKEGGQPGHEGHKRKPHAATETPIYIPAPPEIADNPDFYKQSGPNAVVRKQVVGIRISMFVKEYFADVYRNRITGAKYHAPFPAGVQLDVNYDESVKAFVFLMKNHLNVAEEKIREFLLEMTDGEISISRGMINGIS